MSSWIRFEGPKISHSGKTMQWVVHAVEGGEALGVVSWFGRWRGYAFHPLQGTVFEPTCLRDLADFVQEKTREHHAAVAEKKASAG